MKFFPFATEHPDPGTNTMMNLTPVRLSPSSGRLVWRLRRVIARLKPVPKNDIENAFAILNSCGDLEREAVIRYYQGEDPARIAAETGMTEDEFRDLRMRLRHRFLSMRSAEVVGTHQTKLGS